MTRGHVLVIVLLAAVFLLGGVIVVFFVLPLPGAATLATPPAPTLTPLPTLALTPGAQISILLVGVDSLASLKPNLETGWVLTFVPGAREFYLLGFPPTTKVPTTDASEAPPLSAIYELDAPARDADFTRRALETITPGLSIQAEIVYDRQMLARTIDDLGGIELRDQHMDSGTVRASYDNLDPQDETGRLAFEGDVLKAVLHRDWTAEMLAHHLNLGQHLRPGPAWFLQVSQAIGPLSLGNFIVIPAVTATPAP